MIATATEALKQAILSGNSAAITDGMANFNGISVRVNKDKTITVEFTLDDIAMMEFPPQYLFGGDEMRIRMPEGFCTKILLD